MSSAAARSSACPPLRTARKTRVCVVASVGLALMATCPACDRAPADAPVAAETYVKPDPPPLVEAAPRELPSIRFTDITLDAGIRFLHHNGAFGQKWMPETMGSGCAFFDYNDDDLPDILLVNGTDWPGKDHPIRRATSQVYVNLGDGRFDDRTTDAGLDRIEHYGMGCAAADYDADGDNDVLITGVGGYVFLRNDQGRFVDITEQAGLPTGTVDSGQWSVSALWLDYDRDGWLDLFVCHYVRWTPDTDLFTTYDGVTKSYATPEKYPGQSCRLYRNRGDGTFEDVTESSGVYNPDAKAMSAAVEDFNDDGWPDIVVTNDTQPNFLLLNQGDGTFRDVGVMAGIAYDEAGKTRAGMGVDVARLSTGPELAIAIGNFSHEPVSLYEQVSRDLFVDRAAAKRVSRPTIRTLTFGLLFADLTLNGFPDLVLANGHIEPEINRVQKDITFAQPPQLFYNDGHGPLIDISDRAGPAFREPIVARGLACADIDNDGDLDLLFTTNNGPALLLRNDLRPTANAVRLRLIARKPNWQAIGAVVTLTTRHGQQRRMVRTGGSYLSQSELVLTFGLGSDTQARDVTVRWPDGEVESLGTFLAGATYTIEQGRGQIAQKPFKR